MINVFGRTWSTYWLMDEMHVYYLYDRDLKIVLKKRDFGLREIYLKM